jgi:hypothetical protein
LLFLRPSIATLAAFEAIRRWAALFVRAEFAFLAQ